jgi:hypothetical protein
MKGLYMNDIYDKVLKDSRLKDIPVLYIIRILDIIQFILEEEKQND